VKILFPHCGSLGDEEFMQDARPLWLRYLITIALDLESWNCVRGEQFWAELLRSCAYTQLAWLTTVLCFVSTGIHLN
jgi:hypothetical protein